MKNWITTLAYEVEVRHGKEKRDRIFGDIDRMDESVSAWFDRFTTGMDELNDKEFLQQMMAKHCPCGGNIVEDGELIKDFYNKSKTLEEFVSSMYSYLYEKTNGELDFMELKGNILYLIKPAGEHETYGRCGKGCHCFLAKETEKYISDIFCYCCTIGHTGRPYQYAFGEDIKMEFIESIICGGKSCTMAVYLPEKEKEYVK